MNKKVYLSPSNQVDNHYAYGNTTEAIQCGKIAEACRVALIRSGVDVKVGQYDTMLNRCNASDAFGADLHVPIHTNACNGKVGGTRMFCHTIPGAGYSACQAIYKYLAPLTPGTSEGISVSDFYEIEHPQAPTAYIECEFHDVPEFAKWIVEHVTELGEAIAHGICDYLGVKYVAKAQITQKPTSEVKADTAKIVAGSLVKIKSGACYTTNKAVPTWVRNQNWYIASINGSRAVLGENEAKTNKITSPIDVKYLTLVKTSEPAKTTTQTKKEETCMITLPVLSNGMNNGYVKTLQILLNKYNNAKLEEDGGFGVKTEAAVRAYQKSRGLEVDGVVGAKTWAQLLK